jgi:hypothetical protein
LLITPPKSRRPENLDFCHGGVGYRRYFPHFAGNSLFFSLLSSAFELELFLHDRHAILFHKFSVNPIPLDAMGRNTVCLTSSFAFFPKEKERFSVFISNDLPFESGLVTRYFFIPGPKLFTRNEPYISATSLLQVSSVPCISDLIGFVTFLNGFQVVFLRLPVGSSRTDRRWNL